MKTTTKILIGFLIAFFAVPAVFADLYYETKISGGPRDEGIMKTFLSEYGTRIEPGDNTAIIVNMKDEVFFELNLADKTYKETKFSDFLTDADDSEMAGQMGNMLEQMIASMTVKETDETKTINGYKCKKYIVTIMGSNSDYWLTKDVKGYDEMIKRMDDYRAVFSKNPVLNSLATGYDMSKKLDGFPMKIVNKMMGMEITSEVVKVETKSLDKALFSPPEGFRKTN